MAFFYILEKSLCVAFFADIFILTDSYRVIPGISVLGPRFIFGIVYIVKEPFMSNKNQILLRESHHFIIIKQFHAFTSQAFFILSPVPDHLLCTQICCSSVQ